MQLAIIDPDPVSSYTLSFAAQRRGHQVLCVSGAQRLSTNLPFEPSVVVVALDRLDGAAVASVECVKRALPDSAIIVTAEGKHIAATSLLEHGASDFQRTPYNAHELVLKAEKWHSILAKAVSCESAIRAADLEVDLNKYIALKNGVNLTLTKLELRLLYCLLEHHPNLAPIERLLNFGWDILSTPDASLIKTHISHLRTKLRDAGGVPFEIQSRQTIGYIISWHE